MIRLGCESTILLSRQPKTNWLITIIGIYILLCARCVVAKIAIVPDEDQRQAIPETFRDLGNDFFSFSPPFNNLDVSVRHGVCPWGLEIPILVLSVIQA